MPVPSRLYGFAYYDPYTITEVWAPIPINWAIMLARCVNHWWYSVQYKGTQSRISKSVRRAYRNGYLRGRTEGHHSD